MNNLMPDQKDRFSFNIRHFFYTFPLRYKFQHMKKVCLLILVLSLSAATFILRAQQSPYEFPFRNPALSFDERVNDLVSRMTLQEKADQLVYTSPAIPRLGIPAYTWWNEALHGVARAGYATVFPQSITIANSWD